MLPIATIAIPIIILPRRRCFATNNLLLRNAPSRSPSLQKRLHHLAHHNYPAECSSESVIHSPRAHFPHLCISYWSSSPSLSTLLLLTSRLSPPSPPSPPRLLSLLITMPRLCIFISRILPRFCASKIHPNASFTILLAFKLIINTLDTTISPTLLSNRMSEIQRHSPILIAIPYQITTDLTARTDNIIIHMTEPLPNFNVVHTEWTTSTLATSTLATATAPWTVYSTYSYLTC